MDSRTRTILLWSGVVVLVIAGVAMLLLSFGGSKNTTTKDLNAVYTDVALTLAVQQQTLQAGIFSATPDPALGSPTATFTPLPSPTLLLQTPVLLATSSLATGVVAACDNSVYLSDVTIPDETVVAPGTSFTKTWRVSNTGTCAWTAAYQIVLVAGDGMSGKTTAVGKAVQPGGSVDISVALISPAAAAGSITGKWRLSNDKSQPFGDVLTVVIKSVANGATPTGVVSTITSTLGAETATYTAVPVATTEVPTYTSVPTDTPVPTP